MGKKKLFVLNETAIGYILLKVSEGEEIAVKECDKTFEEFSRFSKTVQWQAFLGFSSQDEALKEMQSVAMGTCTDHLSTWLRSSLPKIKEGKKAKFELGVADVNFGASITKVAGVPCRVDDYVLHLLRSSRRHLPNLVEKNTAFEATDLAKASVGLGHEYSRAKVAFDKKADDGHVVHAISLLEDLNKTLNGMCQRVKEWYGLHFPELDNVCDDQVTYCKVVKALENRLEMTEAKKEALGEIFEDEAKVKEILGLSKISMGNNFSEADVQMVDSLNSRCIDMAETRDGLQAYLNARMGELAPNMTEIIGPNVGAKLIAHCGSLIKLAKFPASTIQVLGAEKALFRALKARSGKTPKYGLIFGSSWISRAKDKDRGRMSRVLANKLAMASRIDCFQKSESSTNIFGQKLRDQLEERLEYWNTGKVPRTNQEVMNEAYDEAKVDEAATPKAEAMEVDEPKPAATESEKPKKKKKKKKKKKTEAKAEPTPAPEETQPAETPKKKKKKKKRKAEEAGLVEEAPKKKQKTEATTSSEKPKKKKKKKKKKKAE